MPRVDPEIGDYPLERDRAAADEPPGDYYDQRAANRAILRECLALAVDRGDAAAVARLREALERASYVGD